MLGLEESLDRLAQRAVCSGDVLKSEENNVLLKALHFELLGRKGRGHTLTDIAMMAIGRPKQTWKSK